VELFKRCRGLIPKKNFSFLVLVSADLTPAVLQLWGSSRDGMGLSPKRIYLSWSWYEQI